MSILLIDLHQLFYANLMMNVKNNIELDENFFRHMVLNSIRMNRVKFKEKYGGETIIATDSWSWRRNVFPHYKANRKTEKDKSSFDWKEIHISLDKIREELKENFPYRVINSPGAEADDIISWVCRNNKGKEILILSGDKDFVQLQTIRGIKQYDPVRKKFISDSNPKQFLYEHILRGDSGDGIPNVLSDGDTFVSSNKRQIPLTKKKLKELDQINIEELENFRRNRQLIDLTYIPDDVMMNIEQEYNSQEGKDRSKMFNYFVQNRLRNLIGDIQDF